jgi:hypothetical protein
LINYVISFEIRKTISSQFIFLFQNCFSGLVPLSFCTNFRILLSVATESLAGVFKRVALKLNVNLRNSDIFTMLSLPVCEHLHIFIYTDGNLHWFLPLTLYHFHHINPACIFLNSHLTNFFSFWVIMNGIMFLISVSWSLLVYGIIMNFCMFTLCSLILLNLLFCLVVLEFELRASHLLGRCFSTWASL